MQRVRVFRYIPEVDAFDVTPEYRQLAELLGLSEWNDVVWIGRLFRMDNDIGEHWFDNWDDREKRQPLAERNGLDANTLFIINPNNFADGADGPCHTPEIRGRFWHDVLSSLELSVDLLFDKARELHRELERRSAIEPDLREDYIPDLETRIAGWRRDHGDA